MMSNPGGSYMSSSSDVPKTQSVEWWEGRVGKAVAISPIIPDPKKWIAWRVEKVNHGAIILENHWDEHDRRQQVIVLPGQIYGREVFVPEGA